MTLPAVCDIEPGMIFRQGDLIFTRSDSWIGRTIRWSECLPGEADSEANHVGIIIQGGTVENAVIVEALRVVTKHTMDAAYGGESDQILVARPLGLDIPIRCKIAREAASHVGEGYGWLKIAGIGFDRIVSGIASIFARRPTDVAVMRRLFGNTDRNPICSVLVARAYRAAGLDFGVSGNYADPDQMLDFVRSRPDKYVIAAEWCRVPKSSLPSREIVSSE